MALSTQARRAVGGGSSIVAVIVAVLVWWLQSQSGGSTTSEEDRTPTPTAATSTAEPSPTDGPAASYPTEPGDAGTTYSLSPGENPSVPESTTTLDATPGPTDPMPTVDPGSGLPYVPLADLPPEATGTVDLIDAGGPYPHDEDDSTFRNDEGILPDRESGYYREYTVETPGSPDRGARRIVAGSEGELYWTQDHYESFERIWR